MRKKNNREVFYNNCQRLHREDSLILLYVHYRKFKNVHHIAAVCSIRNQICIFPPFCKRSERYLGCLKENKSLNHWKSTLSHLHEEIWDSCRYRKVMDSSIFQKKGYGMTFWGQGLRPVSQKETWGREDAWAVEAEPAF